MTGMIALNGLGENKNPDLIQAAKQETNKTVIGVEGREKCGASQSPGARQSW